MILPNCFRWISTSVQREALGESAPLFSSHQMPWFRSRRRKVDRSMSLQLHSALKVATDSGAGGSNPPESLNQKRVTTPKLPAPPPVWAHQSSRLGSELSRVATTLLARPFSSTVTTSTAYR